MEKVQEKAIEPKRDLFKLANTLNNVDISRSSPDEGKALPPLPRPMLADARSISVDQIPVANKGNMFKPKPIPLNHSTPPLITAPKKQANSRIRPSTSASHVGPKLPNAPFLHPGENASRASENWTAPEDADGAYVRRTYAHFDARGVRGDGLLEGKEWTRERGAHAAWEVNDQNKNGKPPRRRRISMPPTTARSFVVNDISKNGKFATRDGRLSPGFATDKDSHPSADSSANHAAISLTNDSINTTPNVSEGGGENRTANQQNDKSAHSSVDAARPIINPTFDASTSSLGSHSNESVVGPLQNGEERAAHHHGHDEEIDVERNELMKKIDRYGFFPQDEIQSGNSFARSRMTILPEAALNKIPKRRIMLSASSSRQGLSGRKKNSWTDEKQSAQKSYDLSGSNDENEQQEIHSRKLQAVIQHRASKELAIRKREALRTAKWDHMLDVSRDSDGKPQFLLSDEVYKSKKLKRRVYKGIPDRWRAAVWWALLKSRSHGESGNNLEVDFHNLQQQPSSHDVQIDLDVPRTISGHILFHTRYGQGQRALFHVLHSFSLLCDQCAYCQGMGPIAATLLVYFPPERAYAALVRLHNDESFGIHQTFSPEFPGLVENFWVQYKIAMMLCPDVVQSLEEKNIVTSAYATKWYITLFTNVFPFATQLRLWDAYFLHGRDVLVIASVAILWSLRQTLVNGNFETCLSSLGREFVPDDDDLLLNWIFLVLQREDIRKAISSARKEWAQMVEQGKTPIL